MEIEFTLWEVAEKIAEIWTENKKRPLSQEEMDLMGRLLEAVALLVWERAKLINLSLMASNIDDMEWLHDICLQLDMLVE